jgi:hypothetical protein
MFKGASPRATDGPDNPFNIAARRKERKLSAAAASATAAPRVK